MYTATIGLTYYFSREYDLPIDCCAELDSIKKLLPLYADTDTVYVHDTIVKFVNVQNEEMASYPFSIFFNRDSYQLMSRRDLVNLREIAEVAKANGYKLRLRGSCDSATATPAYNQSLSENRCRKIMMELIEMGIPEDQIILVPMGGVKELNPTEYDRRVLIELVKEAE
jgi:outer membrane protein OmpA-like peptidoglycan-associated protein